MTKEVDRRFARHCEILWVEYHNQASHPVDEFSSADLAEIAVEFRKLPSTVKNYLICTKEGQALLDRIVPPEN